MTVYYVLNQLGPHSKGDVLSFSPEQIGAGVDISHLTTIGAIRVASGGEIARAVPAQIQATHAPQGVGVFTNNGVPDGTSYAGIAAYGSLCWNVAVSPPTIYVNTGTIATPTWTIGGGSGGLSLPGVTSDGLTPGGIAVAGAVAVTGAVSASAIALSGLTGSTHASRWVGTTPSGAPTVGAHLVGDYATSLDGTASICTVAGTPGTWITAPLPGVASGTVPAPLSGVTPDPTYHPSYVSSSAEVATDASFYGKGLVHFISWTPTQSGTVRLFAPHDDGVGQELDFYVFAGTVIGTNVPSRDGTGAHFDSALADAYWRLRVTSPRTLEPFEDSFSAVAGTTYTIAVVQAPLNFDIANMGALDGLTVPLTSLVLSLQPFGGETPVSLVTATQPGAFAAGIGALATGSGAEAGGIDTQASGEASRATGLQTRATGQAAHAAGQGALASGQASSAEGGATAATGQYARASGFDTLASGVKASADGDGSIASGEASHAEGETTTASGFGSHSEGDSGVASGRASHAEGGGSVASGSASHAEGQGTASGAVSHAEGHATTASATYAHSEGNTSTAAGHASHAEGSHTEANGSESHAGGFNSIAALTSEFAHGFSDFGDGHGKSQYSLHGVKIITTDATVTALLTADGTLPDDSGAIDPGPLTLPTNTTWQIIAQVGASQFDTPGTIAGWTLRALVTVVGGTARQIGSTDLLAFKDAAASTWDVALSAHDTQLDINVTGEAGKTIRWVAALHVVQVGI